MPRKMLRLLVCGDRDWANAESIAAQIRVMHPDVIIEGEARGADRIAHDIALEMGFIKGKTLLSFPADWQKYHKAAGPIRNQQMLDEGKPNRVIAFHSNITESKGTKDMVERARKAGIEVMVFKE
jgi:hypothetical protein